MTRSMPTATSHQTIGPFWHGLADLEWCDLTRFGAKGRPIELRGTITDGDGARVTDACVEIWQTSPPAGGTFPGWGRCATDANGQFAIRTLDPAHHEEREQREERKERDRAWGHGNDMEQAPHIAVMLHARGLLKPLMTRIYFADHPANARDPVLQSLEPARRSTLLAKSDGNGSWHFDIRLQGEHETVFFEI
ncbi:hypothetical protein [Pendulispora albinea]|uniref:Intradiol ring-cleavage dioxygenases domain-containing protein n=1 Tax=Pendulispora albinea TaxID=2741071 RepID=A0ABZ2M503_9BACT